MPFAVRYPGCFRFDVKASLVLWLLFVGCDTKGPETKPGTDASVLSYADKIANERQLTASESELISDESRLLAQRDSAGTEQQAAARATSPAATLHRPLGESSPNELANFLAELDRQAQAISMGTSEVDGSRDAAQALIRVVQSKREASLRLIENPESSPVQITLGQRGLLQALSQASVMGDLAAAEELERAATSLQDHPDASLSGDAKLVLIGFELEKLRNGRPGAKENVLASIRQFLDGQPKPDVAALMVMGQAKDVLRQYDCVDEAAQVRLWIRAAYIEAPGMEPHVVQMATQITDESIDK